MPGIARITDSVSILHPTCSGVATCDVGSGTVFANGLSVHRVSDENTSHTYSPPSCPSHSTPLTSGSPSVFVNGLPVGRVGDTYSCGAQIVTGSPSVFSGG